MEALDHYLAISPGLGARFYDEIERLMCTVSDSCGRWPQLYWGYGRFWCGYLEASLALKIMVNDTGVWVHWKGARTGPYTNAEIDALILRREVSSLHRLELNGTVQSVRDYVAAKAAVLRQQKEASAAKPRFRLARDEAEPVEGADFTGNDQGGSAGFHDSMYLPESGVAREGEPTFTDRLADDLAQLRGLVFSPLAELVNFGWLHQGNTRLLLAAVLPPLFFMLLGDMGWRGESLLWLFGFYFSALWMIFFSFVLRPSSGLAWKAIAAYVTTVLFSMGVMLGVLYHIPILGAIRVSLDLSVEDGSFGTLNLLERYWRMLVVVAIPEEICKLAVVAVLAVIYGRRLSPYDMLYIGLASGLGFGISEGINYQAHVNLAVSDSPEVFHTLNVMRLTALPLLHALWTGVAAYFIGLAIRFPRRIYGLIALACLVPACLHAAHNSFGGLFSLVPCTLSVLALLTYMRDGEKALDRI